MKPVLRTRKEINASNQARVLITAAIAQIDLRGTDENVTAAMIVVDDVISVMMGTKSLPLETICRNAIRKSKI